MLIDHIDVSDLENCEVRAVEISDENVSLSFVNDHVEFSIIMNKKIAKSVHNVTRKFYPYYAVETDKNKVAFVFEAKATPTNKLQTFLKGLTFNEVIV